jgi:predicted nucleic acid-binding protein
MSSPLSGDRGSATDVKLVVDATIAIEIALAGGGLGPLAGHDLVAPALVLSESTSVLREMAFRGEIPRERASTALDALLAVPIEILVPTGHVQEALTTAASLGWAKTYDAEYVAVALRAGCPLVTRDARLRRGAAGVVDVLGPLDIPPA